jgi:WD40 repeat protein
MNGPVTHLVSSKHQVWWVSSGRVYTKTRSISASEERYSRSFGRVASIHQQSRDGDVIVRASDTGKVAHSESMHVPHVSWTPCAGRSRRFACLTVLGESWIIAVEFSGVISVDAPTKTVAPTVHRRPVGLARCAAAVACASQLALGIVVSHGGQIAMFAATVTQADWGRAELHVKVLEWTCPGPVANAAVVRTGETTARVVIASGRSLYVFDMCFDAETCAFSAIEPAPRCVPHHGIVHGIRPTVDMEDGVFHVLVGNHDGSVEWLDLTRENAEGKIEAHTIFRSQPLHSGPSLHVAWCDDGNTIFSGGADGRLTQVDVGYEALGVPQRLRPPPSAEPPSKAKHVAVDLVAGKAVIAADYGIGGLALWKRAVGDADDANDAACMPPPDVVATGFETPEGKAPAAVTALAVCTYGLAAGSAAGEMVFFRATARWSNLGLYRRVRLPTKIVSIAECVDHVATRVVAVDATGSIAWLTFSHEASASSSSDAEAWSAEAIPDGSRGNGVIVKLLPAIDAGPFHTGMWLCYKGSVTWARANSESNGFVFSANLKLPGYGGSNTHVVAAAPFDLSKHSGLGGVADFAEAALLMLGDGSCFVAAVPRAAPAGTTPRVLGTVAGSTSERWMLPHGYARGVLGAGYVDCEKESAPIRSPVMLQVHPDGKGLSVVATPLRDSPPLNWQRWCDQEAAMKWNVDQSVGVLTTDRALAASVLPSGDVMMRLIDRRTSFRAQQGSPEAPAPSHENATTIIALCNDTVLLVAGYDGVAHTFTVSGMQAPRAKLPHYRLSHPVLVHAGSGHAHGTSILAGVEMGVARALTVGAEASIVLWSVGTDGSLIPLASHSRRPSTQSARQRTADEEELPRNLCCAACFPEGAKSADVAVVGDSAGRIALWSCADTGITVRGTSRVLDEGPVFALTVFELPKRRGKKTKPFQWKIACGCGSGAVVLFQTLGGELEMLTKAHSAFVPRGVAVTAIAGMEDETLAVGYDSGTVRILPLKADATEVERQAMQCASAVRALAVEKRRVAVLEEARTLHRWDVDHPGELKVASVAVQCFPAWAMAPLGKHFIVVVGQGRAFAPAW